MIVFAAFMALNASANPAKKTATLTNAKLDVATSTAIWTGKKITGSHTGKVNLKEGALEFNKNKFVKGEVVVDLTSITNEDLKDAGYNKKLVDHLKGEDFFDVAKFPVASFKIESMNEIHNFVPGQPNMEVKGMLTIRGITKPYSTKIFFTPNDSGYDIKGKIIVDRTQFGLKYNSKKFFDPKALGDKLIDDNFEVDLNLVAKK
jgi:hypothetical protein